MLHNTPTVPYLDTTSPPAQPCTPAGTSTPTYPILLPHDPQPHISPNTAPHTKLPPPPLARTPSIAIHLSAVVSIIPPFRSHHPFNQAPQHPFFHCHRVTPKSLIPKPPQHSRSTSPITPLISIHPPSPQSPNQPHTAPISGRNQVPNSPAYCPLLTPPNPTIDQAFTIATPPYQLKKPTHLTATTIVSSPPQTPFFS